MALFWRTIEMLHTHRWHLHPRLPSVLLQGVQIGTGKRKMFGDITSGVKHKQGKGCQCFREKGGDKSWNAENIIIYINNKSGDVAQIEYISDWPIVVVGCFSCMHYKRIYMDPDLDAEISRFGAIATPLKTHQWREKTLNRLIDLLIDSSVVYFDLHRRLIRIYKCHSSVDTTVFSWGHINLLKTVPNNIDLHLCRRLKNQLRGLMNRIELNLSVVKLTYIWAVDSPFKVS